MKTQRRFIKSIVATAKACENTRMPWERGSAREALIARRSESAKVLKRA